MEAYPPEYFTTPLPLLVVAGLGNTESHTALPPYPLLENATLISCDEPLVNSKVGEDLLQYFLKSSADSGWKGTIKRGGRPPNSSAFRVAAVGRNFALPPRKANPPFSESGATSPLEVMSPKTPTSAGFPKRPLHSPISPLTPDSPLYPDGVFSHIWLRKHLYLQPCAFVSFHEFAVVPAAQEEAVDRSLAASINEMKRAFLADPRKIKFAVVLIAQKTLLEAPSIENRFAMIRRLTSLDTKNSLFFLPAKASSVELQQLAKSVELSLTPTAIEFYRELSKHARRKRSRSSAPVATVPPSSMSQTLSNTGWTVRYEMKLALFAEFRAEMDAAIRHYETAYEALLEVFETTNNWSPRWNDIRLLADVMAARTIRCYIYFENGTLAARRWETHRRRMADILDRKGAGTSTYGWAAWEARWAVIMATIVHGSKIFTPDPKANDIPHFYAPIDKSIKVDERVSAIEHLHHAGFYWMMAVSFSKLHKRRVDRLPESDSPVDLYLVKAPEEEQQVDLLSATIRYLNAGAATFVEKGQSRLRSRVLFELAQLEMSRENWQVALDSLKIGLRSWRADRWTPEILKEALTLARGCALKISDAASVLTTSLELHSKVLPDGTQVPELSSCLTDIEGGVQGETTLAIRAPDILPVISAEYAFLATEVSVGELAISQLVLKSQAQSGSPHLTLHEVKVEYKGMLKSLVIRHEIVEGASDFQDMKSKLKEITPSDGKKAYVEGVADLALNPGQIKVFELSSPLREHGDVRVTSITLTLRGEGYDIDLIIDIDDYNPLLLKTKKAYVWKYTNSVLTKVPLKTYRPMYLKILPRPPRLMVKILRLDDPVYIGEPIRIALGVVNEEDEEVDSRMKIRILGYPDEIPLITWDRTETSDAIEDDPETPYQLGRIAPSEEIRRSFTIPSAVLEAEVSLEVISLYVLTSDPETQISKTVKLPPFHVRRPFRTKFDFSPSVHSKKWPNMFRLSAEEADRESHEDVPKGLTQRWVFKCQISLMEAGTLVLDGFVCDVANVQGGIVCQLSRADEVNEQGYELKPDSIVDVIYILEVTKHALEDRRSSDIDLDLKVKWQRPGGEIVVTPLAVPRLLIPGSEPRVLAEASPYIADTNTINLTYTLENPTMHVLTFNVSMDPSDTFHFEGPKQPGVQLMPLTRLVMEYRIYPRIKHDWIRATLRVVDKYYNKNLRIAATDGVKAADKGGLLVWVP
ncbi:hypothetical protein TWF225_001313 [Orbilia oligospora]|nr:hypothetical protein TWF225_001313 [Orbilia oligospora]KAF3258474.1 hypothetical protein TWF128_004716 [Orbilia oligospora]KAF3271156.1 hypothetical protein TWF217_005571 [Orbilia oligospora]KAF3282133.1 hypothetical protein TWF132_010831 [Orbilia oligospora]